MATRTTTTLVDDLDGGPADETIVFAVDGTTYEIDLSAAHAEILRADLAPWLAKARRVTVRAAGSHRGSPTHRPAGRTRPAADTSALRVWARANGWPTLPDRGRIPTAACTAYEAARAAGGDV